MEGSNRLFRFSLLLFVLLAFAIRLYHLDFQSLWRDETDAILFAGKDMGEILSWFTAPGQNGPFYYLLLHLWIALAGRSEFSVRFLSLFWGLLLVPLINLFGSRWLERRVALLAALLAALSPYLIWYSQEAKMYALLAFSSLLSLYFYLRALEENRWPLWLAYLATTGLSMYIHILAVLLIPFQALFYLVTWPRYRGAWRAWLATMALLILPCFPLARWEVPTLLSSFTTGHRFYTLPQIFTILLFAFGLNSAPYRGFWPLALIIFLLLAGTFLYRRASEASFAAGWLAKLRSLPFSHHANLLLALYLLVPVITIYLISLGMPIFTDRYLISVAPAFLLLMAGGLVAIGERSRVVSALCLLLLLSFILPGVWFQSHTKIKSDLRSAAEYVASHDDHLVIFLIPQVRQTFEYYYSDDLIWAEPPYTNRGMDRESVAEAMEEITAERDEVWLLVSEEELWDSRGLVRGWLGEKGRLMERASFARVELYRYRLSR